jgi:hypothetical protein
MIYRVPRLTGATIIDPHWDSPPWQKVVAAPLSNYMGRAPDHFPKTEVKMAYDAASISVFFRVEDRFIRAVATQHQQSICKDSCVEFFFCPCADVPQGYFNLEINCGGTLLFHFHPPPEKGDTIVPPIDLCNRIHCRHSLPRIIEPEITEPVVWTVACTFRVDILTEFCQPVLPAPGVIWRGNFYKCADATSHPHWLTWAPVEATKPNFHLPRFFGILEFV